MRRSRSAAAKLLHCVSYAQAATHLSSAFHRHKVVQQGRLKRKLWLMMDLICDFQLVKFTLMQPASLPITGLTKVPSSANNLERKSIGSPGQLGTPLIRSFADCSQGNNFMTLISTVQAPFLENLGADGRSCNACRLSKLQYLLYVQPAPARFRMKVQILCTRLRHSQNQEAGMRQYTVPRPADFGARLKYGLASRAHA